MIRFALLIAAILLQAAPALAVRDINVMLPNGVNAALPAARENLVAAAHLSTNAALAAAGTTSYPTGLWRDDYAAGNNAPPLFYMPQAGTCVTNSMTADNGSCVNSTSGDGNSWKAVFPASGVDARWFGFSTSASASTNRTTLQSAINAAYSLAPAGSLVRVPIAASINSYVYIPPNVTITCGGRNAQITKGSSGPLFVAVDAIGHTFAQAVNYGQKLVNCPIDNNQLAGTGFLTYKTSGWRLVDTDSINSKAGAGFTVSGIVAGTMTVSSVNRGNIAVGDMVSCAGCSDYSVVTNGATVAGSPVLNFASVPSWVSVGNTVKDVTTGETNVISTSVTVLSKTATTVTLSANVVAPGVGNGDAIRFSPTGNNTHPTVFSQSSGTPGGAGVYLLSNPISALAESAWTAAPWTWTDGPTDPNTNSSFPTADLTFLGGTFNGHMENGIVGGKLTSNNSDCLTMSAQKIYMDSIQTDGVNHPNANVFINLLGQCADAGIVINNGADNTFYNPAHDKDVISEVFGIGASNASGNLIVKPYIEGSGVSHPTDTAFVFDTNGPNNLVNSPASLSEVTSIGQNFAGGNSISNAGGTAANFNLGPSIASNWTIGWTAFHSLTNDTAFSRDGSGVIDLGNGTAFDTSGSLQLRKTVLTGSTSGTLTLQAPATAGTNTLTFPAGTTNFSATGGASQVVKQTSVGGAFTVARLACADLSDASGTCSSTYTALTLFTPTITCGSGAVAGYTPGEQLGSYQQVGKEIVFAIEIQASGIGTCAGLISVPIPVASLGGQRQVVNAFDLTTVGSAPYLMGWMIGNDTNIQLRNAAGGSPTVTDVLVVSGSYIAN